MRLLPAGLAKPSDWEDGLWEEKPGFPAQEGTWIHPPIEGHVLPEYEYEEGHDKNKNEPCPTLYMGGSNDCHIRWEDADLPRRLAKLTKEDRYWYIECLRSDRPIFFGDRKMAPGDRCQLKNEDTFSLKRPPTNLTYKILLDPEDNWYIDLESEKDYPNKYPGKFPLRRSQGPVAPEELKRLAWQTDQMRRRSEEDQVRVADWAAFAQYVKRHYYKYGIECKPWLGSNRPIDPKPPSYPPRAYPAWIADIIGKEHQLPGVAEGRDLPFASCLQKSGRHAPVQLDYKDGVAPRLEDLYVEPRSGPAIARPRPPAPEHTPPFVGGKGGERDHAAPSTQQMSRAKGRGKDAEKPSEPQAADALKMSFKEWLIALDDSKFLLQYHDSIAGNFDSLEQIVEIYWRNGDLQKAFFDDTGIKKLGHKRIFQKWFKDTCGS